MKYLILILFVLGSVGVCEAGCPGGQCRRPVRNTVKAAGKVVAAPFRCHCRNGRCCK